MHQQKVLAVNDLSSVGKCSLGVIIPILSAMKIEVCPVVTTILSAHTGFEHPYIVDLSRHLDPMFAHILSESSGFGFAYSGYLGSSQQMDIVKKHFETLKKSGTKILVDPVLGDHGKCYSAFDATSIEKMAQLCRIADLITPNYTEACLLANAPYQETESDEAVRLAGALSAALSVPSVVITGVPLKTGKCIVIWENGKGAAIPCDYVKGEYSGTGDAFASVLCGCLIKGETLCDAVCKAHRFVRTAIRETDRMGGSPKEGIMVEAFLHLLSEES